MSTATATTASTRQISFIAELFEEVGLNADVEGVEELVAPIHTQLVLAMAAHQNADADDLTKRDASRVIDVLIAAKKLIAAKVPAATVKFRKLDDGTWGLFGDASVVQTGAMVTVVKSNGEEQEKLVGEIVSVDGPNALAKVQNVSAKNTVSPLVEAFHARFGTKFVGVALDTSDGAKNEIAFWFIGAKYVYQVIGGQGRTYMPTKVQTSVLNRLQNMEDDEVREAMAAYGRELGHCGVCSRVLTDDTSRERGIGPICYSRHYGAA